MSGQLPALAQAEDAAIEIAPAPSSDGIIAHARIIVEGKHVNIREMKTQNGETLIDSRPIIDHLRGQIEIEGTLFGLRRFQDGALMSIDMADGKVRANDMVLGKLPDWEPRESADPWLSLNAIAVITGTHVSESEDGLVKLTLDDQLRPQFGLDLFVDDRRIPFVDVEPRTIGPILLVPLREIAEALGHTIVEDQFAGTVTVTRIQDSAVFTLNMNTGLVTVNGDPRGVSPNMSYVDAPSLLLPFTAVETLTGTHIKLLPGTDRVDVRLDDRLGGGALPGERIADEAAETSFTPEKVTFQIADRGSSAGELTARMRGFNTRTRYETAGDISDPEALIPGWLSTEVQALAGWRATLGDSTPTLGELNGVDASRIRGINFRSLRHDDQLLSVSVGAPLSGTSEVGDTGNKPEFDGLVAGAKLIDPEKNREIGVAARLADASEAGRVVASLQQDVLTQAGADDRIGLSAVYFSAEIGAFDGNGVDPLGVRGNVDAAYKLSQQSTARASASLESAAFRSAPANPNFEGVFDNRVGMRANVRTSLDWRGAEDWSVLQRPGAGVRVSVSETDGAASTSIGGAISGRVPKLDIDIGVDVGLGAAEVAATGETVTTDAVNIRALKNFKWGRAQASFSTTRADDSARQSRLVANIALEPVRRTFDNGASIVFSPSLSAVASDRSSFARLGASMLADSGEAFGEKLRVRGQVSALQSVNPDQAQTTFFTSVSGSYDILPNLRLEASYHDDFSDNRDFQIGLRGAVTFNEPRKHTGAIEGAGIVKGRVFFDRNRDGIRQDDEPGIPGVRLGVRNTRLALNVDNSGFYTIQNIPTGLYTFSIDTRTLPLGMLVPEAVPLRATIGDGRITTLDVPIIASGQLRGTVFADANGNGRTDPGETRFEGARMTLTPLDQATGETVEQIAASFGQYAFENLQPGRYRLDADFAGEILSREVELTEDELFAEEHMGFSAQTGAAPDTDLPGEIEFIASLGGATRA